MFSDAEPVTFYAAGVVTDPYSGENEATDWGNSSVALVDSCGIEPVASSEPQQDGRQAVIVGYRLYFDHVVDIDRLWRCEVRGDMCKVNGRPAQWRSPLTGWAAGTVAEVGFTDG